MKVKIRTPKEGVAHERPQWQLSYFDVAEEEARKILTDEQYAHVVECFRDLAHESDPTKSQTQDVGKIQEFYELREKGGILGKINIRVYFSLIESKKLILVLSVYKKEQEGPPPGYVVTRARQRLRMAKSKLGS